MTATLPEVDAITVLALPRSIDWTVAFSVCRKTALLELNGEITAQEADRRIAQHADRDHTDEDRNHWYEGLKDRLGYLSYLHSDDFDPLAYEPEARDQERLIDDTEHDIEYHLRKLIGPHPLHRKQAAAR